ncbi:alpha/beta fold hydrolase [Sphingomonas quercus]|uniref:Alpha/beta hydrolase n=1 Tax=Sphingomonas quercus TaxID=2842451 RepID=A0ABS6BE97_9SPHN|nr:alpha/beta hydrolase [Sphingomonas quercus]MBU3076633.1 alpha/beta hydrolase [Sphingomonas quercus]
MTARAIEWHDGWWWSRDGLRLHYRDYPGRPDRPPIVCVPGLTRNARDFEGLAARLAGDWRLICVELRGRGESAYARDSMTYVPLTYLQDLEALITELQLARFVYFGTSLGGLLGMLLAATGRSRFAGVLLNDIGPELDPRGLERIRGYVGKPAAYPTWLHAARALADGNAAVFPDYALQDWLAMAKRLCRLNASGRIVYDYDMKIAEPMRLHADAIDLWPAAEALRDMPGLLVRGALSDILSAESAERMVSRIGLELVTLPRTGHAPTLDEPPVAEAIDRLLARVA